MRTGPLLFAVISQFAPVVGIDAQYVDHSLTGDIANQMEMSIAVNPSNPAVQLAVWNNAPIGGGTAQPGYGFSTDGRASWPYHDVIAVYGHDPSAAFDAHGFAYYSYVNASQQGHIYLSYTQLPSHSFTSSNPVTPSGQGSDKPYMAVDNTGLVFDGRVYVVWIGLGNSVLSSHTTDHGSTWSPVHTHYGGSGAEVETDDSPESGAPTECPNVAVGPDGTVYVVYTKTVNSTGSIYVDTSHTGGNHFGSSIWVTNYSFTTSGSVDYRIVQFPSLAIDQNTGVIYLAYLDSDLGYDRVLAVSSSNHGGNWTSCPPVAGEDADVQFHPWVTVDPTGRVAVFFLQTPDGTNVDAYISESLDNGADWGTPLKISSKSSTNNPVAALNDYQGMASTVGYLYPLWTDARDPVFSAYTAAVNLETTSSASYATAYGSSPKCAYTSTDGRWNSLFATNGSLYYTYSTNSGQSWLGYQNISGPTVDFSSNPTLVAKSNGDLHAVWINPQAAVYYNRRVSGSWLSSPICLWSSAPSQASPAFALGSNDSGHVVWVQSNIALQTTNYTLIYGTFKVTDANPTIATTCNIATSSSAISSPTITLDQNNKPHVAWANSNDIFYSNRTGTVWTAPANISNNSSQSASPSIFARGTTVDLVWQDMQSGNWQIWYSSYSGGAWSTKVNVSNTTGSAVEPFLSGPVVNGSAVVWADASSGTYAIRYAVLGPNGGETGQLSSTNLPSYYYPTFVRISAGSADKLLVMWTVGSGAPYVLLNTTKTISAALEKPAPGRPGELALAKPLSLELSPSYPNPSNPTTTISFNLPADGHARLRVFDLVGREVATLVDADLSAGSHKVTFDATKLATGAYIYRLETAGRTLVKKMVLTK